MLAEATDANFEQRILELCPNAAGKFRKTSERTRRYNCYAWALGDDTIQWIPGGDSVTSRWPPGAPRDLAVASVVRAFEQMGFVREGEGMEAILEAERIALFVDADGDVIHLARRLPSGTWTSKMGTWEDIEHDDLEALVGGEYVRVAAVLRKVSAPAVTTR